MNFIVNRFQKEKENIYNEKLHYCEFLVVKWLESIVQNILKLDMIYVYIMCKDML